MGLHDISSESGDWVNVVKTADESLNTSTTVQNDDHLFFTVVSGAIYQIELGIVYASPVGAGTPDIKMDFGEDTTARGMMGGFGISNTETIFATAQHSNQTGTIVLGTAAGDRACLLAGLHMGAGGTWRLRWAQNTSNANDLIVRAGSFVRYRRVK